MSNTEYLMSFIWENAKSHLNKQLVTIDKEKLQKLSDSAEKWDMSMKSVSIPESDIQNALTFIANVISRETAIPIASLMSRKRSKQNILIRKYFIHVCVDFSFTLYNIADYLSLDHSSIMFHRDRVRNLMQVDPSFKKILLKLKLIVKQELENKYSN